MEHVSTTTLIVTLIIMVFVSAYFSGSETGMMTLNRYKLRHLAKNGNRAARRVEKLLRRPDRLISLVLIGNNLVNILASALATIVGMRLYGDAGVAIATGILTFAVLVFSEVLPKTIAALYPEKVAYPQQLSARPVTDRDDAAGVVAEHHYASADEHGGHQKRWGYQRRIKQGRAAYDRE